MKAKSLLPHRLRIWGWILLIPSTILGILALFGGWEPKVFEFSVPTIYYDELFGEERYFTMIRNNVLDEILGILIIVGGIFVAFSKEKVEDEFIAKIRLESLVWAVYVNYAVLVFAMLFIYSESFYFIMIFNMFTILFFFIGRFHYKLRKLKTA